MRIALIADIHGNLVSLDAVLTRLGPEPVDQIVCLGDVAATGPQPRDVLARLRELGCPIVMCVHGSPRSNMEAVRATTPDGELDAMLAGVTAAVVAGGHTHTPLLRRHGDIVVVNPGSVGLPYERLPSGRVRNPPWAEYGIVEWQDGQVALQFRRTPVDVGAVVDAAKTSAMPHAAWWISGWS